MVKTRPANTNSQVDFTEEVSDERQKEKHLPYLKDGRNKSQDLNLKFTDGKRPENTEDNLDDLSPCKPKRKRGKKGVTAPS